MTEYANLNLLPASIPVFLGDMRNHGGLRYYNLLKGGKHLTIQAPPTPHALLSLAGLNSNPQDDEAYRRSQEEYYFDLEKLQTMIPTLDFDRAWMYWYPRSDGNHRIIYRHNGRYRPPVPEQPWAALVEEKDIRVTNWVSCAERHGWWTDKQGKEWEVDLYIAWDETNADYLCQEMRAYRAMEGLDIMFELLAHVVDHGKVIGIMTAAALGRRVEYRDRSLVYAAIAQLESRRIIYKTVDSFFIMIGEDGKVRLRNLESAIVVYRQDEQEDFDRACQIMWREMSKLFDVDLGGPARAHIHANLPSTRTWNISVSIISTCPSPFSGWISPKSSALPPSMIIASSRTSKRSHARLSANDSIVSGGRSSRLIKQSSTDAEDSETVYLVATIHEAPLGSHRLRLRDSRPPARTSKPRVQKALLAPED